MSLGELAAIPESRVRIIDNGALLVSCSYQVGIRRVIIHDSGINTNVAVAGNVAIRAKQTTPLACGPKEHRDPLHGSLPLFPWPAHRMSREREMSRRVCQRVLSRPEPPRAVRIEQRVKARVPRTKANLARWRGNLNLKKIIVATDGRQLPCVMEASHHYVDLGVGVPSLLAVISPFSPSLRVLT